MNRFWILLLLLLSSCAGGPRSVSELNEEYTTVWGTVAASSTIEGDRIFIYVREEPAAGETEGVVKVCVAENHDNTDVLKRLAERLTVGATVYVFGRPIKGPWYEYIEGVEFEALAVRYYNPKAEEYQTVITYYGPGFRDALRSIGWGHFIKLIGERAVKGAIP